MEIRPTTMNEAAMGFGNTAAVITYADLVTAGGATATATLAIFPVSGTAAAGWAFEVIGYRLDTAFDASDSGINSLLMEVGDGGDTDRLLTQSQLAVDGTEVLYKTGTGISYAFATADTLDALFTVAGGGSPLMNELTSGQVTLFFNAINLAAAQA